MFYYASNCQNFFWSGCPIFVSPATINKIPITAHVFQHPVSSALFLIFHVFIFRVDLPIYSIRWHHMDAFYKSKLQTVFSSHTNETSGWGRSHRILFQPHTENTDLGQLAEPTSSQSQCPECNDRRFFVFLLLLFCFSQYFCLWCLWNKLCFYRWVRKLKGF